ncbi:MAG: hypothetical protein LBT40_03195 [Deltaproteobacteria bacterium]|jgi:hypothetical protein|nr:hypothetical protein [Deltaproteobacteria bacterium]
MLLEYLTCPDDRLSFFALAFTLAVAESREAEIPLYTAPDGGGQWRASRWELERLHLYLRVTADISEGAIEGANMLIESPRILDNLARHGSDPKFRLVEADSICVSVMRLLSRSRGARTAWSRAGSGAVARGAGGPAGSGSAHEAGGPACSGAASEAGGPAGPGAADREPGDPAGSGTVPEAGGPAGSVAAPGAGGPAGRGTAARKAEGGAPGASAARARILKETARAILLGGDELECRKYRRERSGAPPLSRKLSGRAGRAVLLELVRLSRREGAIGPFERIFLDEVLDILGEDRSLLPMMEDIARLEDEALSLAAELAAGRPGPSGTPPAGEG